ncbi:glycoside hydrolase [Daedaleopsis nitida]|nr:glycoside hydrolase [Daedaleopsis nitida]
MYSMETLQGSTPDLKGSSPYLFAGSTTDLPGGSVTSLPDSPFLKGSHNVNEALGLTKESLYPENRPRKKRGIHKRPWFPVLVVFVLVAAGSLAAYFAVIRPRQKKDAAESSSGFSSGSSTQQTPVSALTVGGDGSTVTKEDGSTFQYKNSFGGYWVSNAADPFDNSARPNSWTPALNETWQWGKDRINGVNLGGLFVLEPFISPTLYQDNPSAADEWGLSTSLLEKGQLLEALEDHYNTFITEEDIAEIAGAGLNWVRLPIPFWAVDTWSDVGQQNSQTVAEPFLAKVCWKYVLRVLGWARKYGLRVLLDLHTIPGSQNGFNHSGKYGSVNWLFGTMGLANAQRSLDYIRVITEFISQPEYRDLIPMFGVVNEPSLATVGRPALESFYCETYKMIRDITGVGEGNGPMIAYHTGFDGISEWAGFLQGADRIVLDDHPYFAFTGAPNREPVNTTADGGDGVMMGGKWVKQACDSWSVSHNTSQKAFGVTIAGEFSNAINDCGTFVLGPNRTAKYGDDCEYWSNSAGWSDATKQGLLNFALASMDSLGDWFFWTWKIGNAKSNTVEAPLWSYKLGLEGGWMPKDPRQAIGMCAKFGVSGQPFDGVYEPWMTGGAGAGTIAPTATQNIQAWPPSLSAVPGDSTALVPQYTSTGTFVTLSPPTFTPVSGVTPTASVGNGWANPTDTLPAVTAIAGCAYPFAWDSVNAQIPASGCTPA